MKELVKLFVDGSEVNYGLMLASNLIEKKYGGYVLTAFKAITR